MGLGVNYKCQVFETKVPLEKKGTSDKITGMFRRTETVLGFTEPRVPERGHIKLYLKLKYHWKPWYNLGLFLRP